MVLQLFPIQHTLGMKVTTQLLEFVPDSQNEAEEHKEERAGEGTTQDGEYNVDDGQFLDDISANRRKDKAIKPIINKEEDSEYYRYVKYNLFPRDMLASGCNELNMDKNKCDYRL